MDAFLKFALYENVTKKTRETFLMYDEKQAVNASPSAACPI
jgi:hypothetical protein